MDSRFTVTFEGDHVRIVTDAEKNLDYATALWTEVVGVCQRHDCFDVLVVSNAPAPMPTFDGFDHAELFQNLGIDRRFRIAFAELNDDARDATRFVQMVLANRNLPGEVFSTEDEAREWLFPKTEKPGR